MAITDIDEAKLEAFIGHAATELGAALNTALVTLGEELGLYKAMADGQPVTAAELAARTGTVERYVREWLNTQAASGFVVYDEDADAFVLPPEHALVLADEASPYQMLGSFQAANAAVAMRERIAESFVDGDGVGWHEHHHDLFHGTERAFATSYRNFLVSEWLPALDGVVEKLEAGALVADIGCGHGASSIQLGAGVPELALRRDRLPRRVDRDRARAGGDRGRGGSRALRGRRRGGSARRGLRPDRVLRRAPRPRRSARARRARAAGALAPDGTCMIVEPFAGDSVAENLDPVGRFYYGFSTLVCTPGSLSQPGRAGLGTQAGEARLAEVLIAGGFAGVRRAAESPLHLVLEARL